MQSSCSTSCAGIVLRPSIIFASSKMVSLYSETKLSDFPPKCFTCRCHSSSLGTNFLSLSSKLQKSLVALVPESCSFNPDRFRSAQYPANPAISNAPTGALLPQNLHFGDSYRTGEVFDACNLRQRTKSGVLRLLNWPRTRDEDKVCRRKRFR